MDLDTRTKAVINAIAVQRTNALDMLANYEGEVAVLREQVADLTAKLEASNKPLEEATPEV